MRLCARWRKAGKEGTSSRSGRGSQWAGGYKEGCSAPVPSGRLRPGGPGKPPLLRDTTARAPRTLPQQPPAAPRCCSCVLHHAPQRRTQGRHTCAGCRRRCRRPPCRHRRRRLGRGGAGRGGGAGPGRYAAAAPALPHRRLLPPPSPSPTRYSCCHCRCSQRQGGPRHPGGEEPKDTLRHRRSLQLQTHSAGRTPPTRAAPPTLPASTRSREDLEHPCRRCCHLLCPAERPAACGHTSLL